MFRRVGRKRDVEDAAAEGQRQAAPSEPVGRKTSATLGAFQAGVDAQVRRRPVGDRDGDRPRSRQSDAVTSAAMHLQRKRSVLGADERAEQESNAAAGQGVSRIRRNESATDPVERGSAPTERVRRRGAASRGHGDRPATQERSGSEIVRRADDEPSGSGRAAPPDFTQPVTAEQVTAFPLRAAQQMKNNDAVCRNIHTSAFASSWVRAKHALIGNPETEKVMEQLLVFRQRSHDRVFAKTMLKIESKQAEEGGLTSASAAGSQSLSSDIDANLKGTSTEDAVAVFNEIFSKDEEWGMESGVVFDINVYALDFMHGTTDAGGQGLQAVGEGARVGAAAGGVASRTDADADVVGADLMEQRSWALAKVRHYTTLTGWQAHLEASATPLVLYNMAQDRHLAYYREVTRKMVGLSKVPVESLHPEARALVDVPSEDVTPQESLEHVAAALVAGKKDADVGKEQLMLSSANRIYEEKLTEVAQIRKELEGALEHHELASKGLVGTAVADAERNVEIHLTLLRDKISEGNLFANEAYLTDGAVNHAVQGLQIGKQIRQTAAQGGDAITENMADALKEIHRHGKTLGEAAFKSGKYLFRLADAAKNAGVRDGLVYKTYALGDMISNRIKKTDYSKPGVKRPEGKGDPHELASAAAVRAKFGSDVTNPEQLAEMVQKVGGLAMSQISALEPDELGRPVLKPVKRD